MEFEQAMKKWRNIDFKSLLPLLPKAQEKNVDENSHDQLHRHSG